LKDEGGSLKEKTFRSGLWVAFGSIVVRSIEFLRSIILARLLSPEIFGLMAIILMVCNGLDTVSNTGFSEAIVQKKIVNKETTDTAWVISILRGCCLAVLLFLCSSFVAAFYHRPELGLFLKIVCVGFIIQGLKNTNTVLYRKELNFKFITISQQITMIFYFFVVVTAAYFLRSVWALIIGQLSIYFCNMIISYYIQPVHPTFYFNKKIAKELFSYGKFLAVGAIVVFITLEIDNAIIGRVLGMDALGFYALAYTLANLPATHISRIVSDVMFPAYSKLQDDLEGLNRVYLKTLRLITTFSVPAATGIVLLAPEIVGVVYGEKWLPAVPALQVLCLFGLLRSIGATAGSIFNAINKPHISLYLVSTKLTIIALIIYPLTIKYGTLGTAFAIVLPTAFMQFVLWYLMVKVTRIRVCLIFNDIAPSVIGSAFMAAGVLFAKKYTIISNGALSLITHILIGAFIYSCFQIFFQRKLIKSFLLKEN